MKKIYVLILTSVVTLSLAGCNSSSPDKTQTSPDQSSLAQNSAVSRAEESSEENNIFDLTKYESDDIYYIEKVESDSQYDEMCETYEFSFTSDGHQIKGYISIPAESIKTQKSCKCLVFCRGGNCNLGGLYATDTAMRCAVSGRVTISCELRGCNGSEGADQFGGEELHDVIRLIDLCEKKFTFVNMDDLCVEGESRGGMMTYMAARQDKRIKRIVVVSGISDMFCSYEERDDMKEALRNFIGGTPKELPEEYEKRSAVLWADEIDIPVLLIHSRLDKQVSFEQAEKIYEKLKDHTECTFIKHDDDVHGFHEEDVSALKEWLEND